MSDPEIVRRRTTRGWKELELTSEEANRVLSYLRDGRPQHLDGTHFAAARKRVLAEMAPKKPLPDPVAPLSAEELMKLVPGAADVTGPEVRMFNSETAQFFLVVGPDHAVHLQSKMEPEEVLDMLHALMHDVQESIRRRDAGLN